MQLRPKQIALLLLIVFIGVWTVLLFAWGRAVPGVIGCVVLGSLAGSAALAARERRLADSASPSGPMKSASAPPDGHVRFTLVVEGLEPDRISTVWADLCRTDREPSEDFRRLFQNFTVVEGRRFRFLKGDPTATAALLQKVLGAASGVSVRTSLEPAAERTAPWN